MYPKIANSNPLSKKVPCLIHSVLVGDHGIRANHPSRSLVAYEVIEKEANEPGPIGAVLTPRHSLPYEFILGMIRNGWLVRIEGNMYA